MTDSLAHLSEGTMEQLVEGNLPDAELREATAHLQGCARCAAELDAYRALDAMLADLPRFAPSAEFGDRVMARVRVAPQPSPVWGWLQRWAPSTRRGWVLLGTALAAPAAPLVALVVWLLSEPLISAAGLGQWMVGLLGGGVRGAVAQGVEWSMQSGVLGMAQMLYQQARDVPLEVVAGLLIVLAFAIPLSAWSLFRLVRPPMGKIEYAS